MTRSNSTALSWSPIAATVAPMIRDVAAFTPCDRWKRPLDHRDGRLLRWREPDVPVLSLADACRHARERRHGAAGVELLLGHPEIRARRIVAIDLDNAVDPASGAPCPAAVAIIEAVGSYAERSPGGDGVHILAVAAVTRTTVYGKRPLPGGGTIELHVGGPVTITGRHLASTPADLVDAQAAVEALVARYWPPAAAPASAGVPSMGASILDDDALRNRLRRERGGKAAALLQGDTSGYPSSSEARSALAFRCAFYGAPADQIARILRASSLWKASDTEAERDRKAAHDAAQAAHDYPGALARVASQPQGVVPATISGGAPVSVAPARQDVTPATGGICSAERARVVELQAALDAVTLDRDRLRVERDAERRGRLDAEARLKAAERRADRAAELQARAATVIGNKRLGQARLIVPALLHTFEAAAHNGTTVEGWTRMSPATLAEAGGISDRSASKHLRQLEAMGLIRYEVRSVAYHVDPGSGEVIPFHSEAWARPAHDVTTLARTLTDAAGQDDAPARNWGGRRERRCQQHPDAPLVRQTVWRCSVCAAVVDTDARTVPPDPARQDVAPETPPAELVVAEGPAPATPPVAAVPTGDGLRGVVSGTQRRQRSLPEAPSPRRWAAGGVPRPSAQVAPWEVEPMPPPPAPVSLTVRQSAAISETPAAAGAPQAPMPPPRPGSPGDDPWTR